MNYNGIKMICEQPEYDKQFWNFMKGDNIASNYLRAGRSTATGTYSMPVSANKKYEDAIIKESVIRNIASVFTCYKGSTNIIATDCDDIAKFVPEFESIDIKKVADDFTSINVTCNKLAILLRLPTEFISDSAFNLEGYLVKRLAKNFARAEDKSFITGTGTNEPVGILNSVGGADIAVNTDNLTYDDIITLYFSVDAEYRKNAVWLMNDETAMALRKLKDNNGNYLWNNADNTILGKPLVISEYMPSATEGNKPIAFGDFSYYWIIKRTPVSVRMLQELFAIRHQTGYLAFEFIDGKLIRSEAIKVIKINGEKPGSE